MKSTGRPAGLHLALYMLGLALQFFAIHGIAADTSDAASELAIVDLGNERFRVGKIEVNKREQRFTVTGRVIQREMPDNPVEYLAVVPDGYKSYETLLELDAGAREFNLACILIGLDSRNAVLPRFHFDPEPVKGDPVDLTVSWEEGDNTITRHPGEFISIDGLDKLAEEWVYTGSVLTDKGVYLAESVGLLISFAHEPMSIIDHRTGIGIGAYGAPKINQEKIPPPGTPLTMTISRSTTPKEAVTP
jgi:hypothetical protein